MHKLLLTTALVLAAVPAHAMTIKAHDCFYDGEVGACTEVASDDGIALSFENGHSVSLDHIKQIGVDDYLIWLNGEKMLMVTVGSCLVRVIDINKKVRVEWYPIFDRETSPIFWYRCNADQMQEKLNRVLGQ